MTNGISQYLIQRLQMHQVEHIFGVPGDFVLGFYEQLQQSSIQVINTCDEQGAGFASDAYARICGLGALCVTYGVGAMKVMNSTAQAFAERSPVVVISGAPGMSEQKENPLLHHKIDTFDRQYKLFKQITAASTVINNPETALAEIDRVISTAVQP